MMPLIRDYKKGDFMSLQNLWELTDMGQSERDDTEEVIERCNAMGGKLLIMEIQDTKEIIGSSWMTWDGRRISLHHFGIMPTYQNRGFGTMLAEKSVEWIREKGQQVKLEVHKQNLPAKRLYENFGFISFKDYDIYMKRDV